MDPADVRIHLQTAVAEARRAHEDLVERERICRANRYTASADALAEKADRAFDELVRAKHALAQHDKRHP